MNVAFIHAWMAVLSYAMGQIMELSDLLRHPEWLQKDRSVIVAVAIMYLVFIVGLFLSQKKANRDDRYFADAVRGGSLNFTVTSLDSHKPDMSHHTNYFLIAPFCDILCPRLISFCVVLSSPVL